MYRILKKTVLAPSIKEFIVEAPLIATSAKAGQFVIVRIDERGERIPLTLADFDKENGTITLIFQEVGKSTAKMGRMEQGDAFRDVVGPLGNYSHVEKLSNKVVFVAGGVGIAPVFPIARAFKEAGNIVYSIIGARSKDLLFWEDRMKEVSDKLLVTTDDGSYGRKGFVTDALKELMETEQIDLVVAIGPVIMMKFVCKVTKEKNIKTVVSLNPIMLDGTGMCGACRVEVGGKTKFACVHGPEFDGHEVDFDLLMKRQGIYLEQEKCAMDEYRKECECRAVKSV